MIKRDCNNLWRIYTGEIACTVNTYAWEKECKGCKDYYAKGKS